MGQKVNPVSNRLGIIRGWDSSWFGKYDERLVEDNEIRKYLNARLAKASISRIVIERTLKLVTITVCTARPGLIIGKNGSEVDKLKEELKKIRHRWYSRAWTSRIPLSASLLTRMLVVLSSSEFTQVRLLPEVISTTAVQARRSA